MKPGDHRRLVQDREAAKPLQAIRRLRSSGRKLPGAMATALCRLRLTDADHCQVPSPWEDIRVPARLALLQSGDLVELEVEDIGVRNNKMGL
jgi:hypothetical protein